MSYDFVKTHSSEGTAYMPLNILQCISSMSVARGGPPRVVEGLSLGLADLGNFVSILSDDVSYLEEDFRRDWPKLAAHKNISFLAASSMRDETSLIAEFDRVHFHGVWAFFFLKLSRTCLRLGVNYYISAHGCLDPWSMKQKSLKKKFGLYLLGFRKFLDSASAVFYATQDEVLMASTLLISSPAQVLTNGVNFTPRKVQSNITFPAAAESALACDIRIIFFSRIHKKKGVDLLVQAFAKITDQYHNMSLMIVGIKEDAQLEKKIRGIALQHDRIFFTTDLIGPSARALLSQCNCFALPTFQEGFSIAVLEAMASGLPVLITPECRLPEAIALGAGWECQPNTESVQQSLHQIAMESKETLSEMGKISKNYVQSKHCWSTIAQDLQKYYLSSNYAQCAI